MGGQNQKGPKVKQATACENKFLSEENDSFEKIKRIAVKSYADPEVVKAKLEKYGFTASITKNAHKEGNPHYPLRLLIHQGCFLLKMKDGQI